MRRSTPTQATQASSVGSPQPEGTTSIQAAVARLAELLHAPMALTDEQGAVIAACNPRGDDDSPDLAERIRATARLRIPLGERLQGRSILVGEALDREVISPRLAQVLIELVIGQMTSHKPTEAAANALHKDQLITNLLHGLFEDDAGILRDARRLGLDLTTPRAVLLIDAASFMLDPADRADMPDAAESRIHRRAQIVIGSIVSFFFLPNDTICGYLGDGEIAILKASNTRNLERWAGDETVAEPPNASWANLHALKRAGDALRQQLESDLGAAISVGIGRYHPGLRGLARSYQDARAALVLGRRFHDHNQVYCLDSLGIAAFVGVPDEATKVELARYLLSPLDHEPDLLATLSAFFAHDCSPGRTAQALRIHRNSLTHRLNKIASLTGLDPRRFDDGVQIRLALLLRRLAQSSSE
jgi:carbohydrate diacid regulator